MNKEEGDRERDGLTGRARDTTSDPHLPVVLQASHHCRLGLATPCSRRLLPEAATACLPKVAVQHAQHHRLCLPPRPCHPFCLLRWDRRLRRGRSQENKREGIGPHDRRKKPLPPPSCRCLTVGRIQPAAIGLHVLCRGELQRQPFCVSLSCVVQPVASCPAPLDWVLPANMA